MHFEKFLEVRVFAKRSTFTISFLVFPCVCLSSRCSLHNHITLKLSNMVISSERELDVYISTSAVAAGIIADAETAEFDFIRWAEDSVYMLIRYEAESTGYFWYNYDTGEIDGILEI